MPTTIYGIEGIASNGDRVLLYASVEQAEVEDVLEDWGQHHSDIEYRPVSVDVSAWTPL